MASVNVAFLPEFRTVTRVNTARNERSYLSEMPTRTTLSAGSAARKRGNSTAAVAVTKVKRIERLPSRHTRMTAPSRPNGC